MRVLTPLNFRGLGAPIGVDDSGRDVRALITRSVTVPSSTKPPVQSPGQACGSDWMAWKVANPVAGVCAGDAAGQQQFAAICVQMRMGTLAPATGLKMWTDYVARRCKQAQPSAPPYRPPPATRMPPPGDLNPPPMNSPPLDMPDLPHDGRDPGGGFPGGGVPGGVEGPTTGVKAFLRQVGPVVGIGLLAAIVLTVARKKKLFKRRR